MRAVPLITIFHVMFISLSKMRLQVDNIWSLLGFNVVIDYICSTINVLNLSIFHIALNQSLPKHRQKNMQPEQM